VCGIIAVVRRRSDRPVPDGAEVLAALERALAVVQGARYDAGGIDEAAGILAGADAALRGTSGVRGLLATPALIERAAGVCERIGDEIGSIEAALDAGAVAVPADLERTNAALVRLKDAVWAIHHDRLRTAREVGALAGADPSPAAIEAFTSVQQALSSLDRLEVRGRDSAGLHLLVRDHGLDLSSPSVQAMLDERVGDGLFRSMAVRTPEGHLSFVYKAAAEIGELGDNTRELRRAMQADALLHLALENEAAETLVLGHTRWASVGIISQANAHPLNSDEEGRTGPYVTAVLNGDVDNFGDLKASEGLRIPAEITTDAKVIPTLVSRHLEDGVDVAEAFRRTVVSLEGSVAIAASVADAPERLLLALRGSGQALYVGLADDLYIVASEPYGVVEETDDYIRMDGETPANLENPTASRGQIVVLDGSRAGERAGVRRVAYDGTELPVTDADIAHAQITTRDIDRGPFPHFLLKEMTESPGSFRKTLRGKLVERDGELSVVLGDETLSPGLRRRLREREIRRVVVIGQGTAAVAGQSLAGTLRVLVPEAELMVDALPATELSGFGLAGDMADTLIVAISQSGTTTDTNRTVDLARARGATVVAIVNRRNSDLTDKADGVLYTSDGRDVEMSVASTKAFYAQIAAGFLLAIALAEELGHRVDRELLAALRDLPRAMTATLERRPDVAVAAQQFAPSRRYWAVVGNGPNRIAAQEVRIKLSELCYKSIACDATEDKKHIDLSSEPLIFVCAAGLSGSNADDVAKEVAIYRAHKAAPIVVATEGEARFSAALHVVSVPATDPRLAFVLSAMVGHLFGYEAALAIDAQALPLREARATIEAAVDARAAGDGEGLLRQVAPAFEPVAVRFFDGLRAGTYDGHLEASTGVRLSTLLRYVLGVTPLESYQLEYGKVGTPAVLVEDLAAALTRAIEELTRPVDAIKHQAKTVTVGISRADETLLQVPLVQAVLAAGAPRDRLTYKTLRTLADVDPAVAEVTGYTRYRIEGRPTDHATIVVVDRGGIARDLPSRAERNPDLRGTKHRVATEREPLVAKGRSDGRPIVIVPEVKDNQTTGITLLHVRFGERLTPATARSVLQGYRGRFAALHDAVTETEPTFREDLLGDIAVADLLTEPVNLLADRWRT
jgi:glucosamine--fructose-6-phosphate aminotransferase (isomerizing)